MVFEKIKGYSKLCPTMQKLFQRVYKKHQAVLGAEARKEYKPISVEWKRTYLKVAYKNGKWLHYTPGGEWY